MNIVMIVSDTFRKDHLGCYGNANIHTPNLDYLADRSRLLLWRNNHGRPMGGPVAREDRIIGNMG